MRVWPIGVQSRLLLAQHSLLYTPRILQYGIAQSLLALRLRRAAGCFSYPVVCHASRQWAPVVDLWPFPAYRLEEIKPLDLVWPSEVQTDEIVVIVMEEPEQRPRPMPGSIIDLVS